MRKYSFKNDYSELAHPRILSALSEAAGAQLEGYGLDEISFKAGGLIKTMVNSPSADVHFVSGGTQANLIAISSALRPHEAVIACESGHISLHEAGAIEASGHKICAVEGHNGKLRPGDIESVVRFHADEHMVKPRLVFVSQSTEVGTVYTKAELSAVSEYCRDNGLYLYLDGARLGAGINSPACDLTYGGVAALTDMFYIGGTKNGALFGEAIVIPSDELKADFRFHLKQKGAMLAKGAAIGAQFAALMDGGLYDRLAARAGRAALELAAGIAELGYEFLYPAQTNQIFPVFPEQTAEKLHNLYDFYDWSKTNGMTAVRLVVSWAAPENIIGEFLNDLAGMK